MISHHSVTYMQKNTWVWSSIKLKRLITSGAFGLYTTLPQLFNLAVSILAIRLISDVWWGQFLELYILISLISMITSFGNNEYLIREWSNNSQQIGQLWLDVLVARLPLLILCIPFLYIFLIPQSYWLVFIFWAISEFLYKSFNPIIVFNRKFGLSIVLNILSSAIIATIIITNHSIISVFQLAMTYGALVFIKAIILLAHTKTHFTNTKSIAFNFPIIVALYPFFFPSIIGFIQSQIDTYVVAYKMPVDNLAQYHPLLKSFGMMHSLAFFAIAPFMKNIYRLNKKSIQILTYKFSIIGFLGAIAGIISVYVLMRFYFKFHFPLTTYLLGYLQVVPLFIYYIPSIQLIKHNKQLKIVFIGVIATFMNFFLSIILLKPLGLNGALAASVITQWFTMFAIKYSFRTTMAQQ